MPVTAPAYPGTGRSRERLSHGVAVSVPAQVRPNACAARKPIKVPPRPGECATSSSERQNDLWFATCSNPCANAGMRVMISSSVVLSQLRAGAGNRPLLTPRAPRGAPVAPLGRRSGDDRPRWPRLVTPVGHPGRFPGSFSAAPGRAAVAVGQCNVSAQSQPATKIAPTCLSSYASTSGDHRPRSPLDRGWHQTISTPTTRRRGETAAQ
jgi:hypothetical protein